MSICTSIHLDAPSFLQSKGNICIVDVPGVLSVQPDKNFGSNNKDYRGLSYS